MSPKQTIEHVLALYALRGDEHHGESVSQREHARQCAFHARAAGASDALVVAALLHDAGHLLQKHGEDAAARGIDTQHEKIAAAYLARALPPAVTQPIALHVNAKRYLATVQPSYGERLSPASRRSFILQGGVMSRAEQASFEADPYLHDANNLRFWDEAGKLDGVTMPPFEHYIPLIWSFAP